MSHILHILLYLNQTPKQWVQNGEFDEPADFGYYAGHKWWIAVPAGAGLVIGVIRYIFTYPENLDGIFKEINTCHVDYRHAPLTLIISMISLAFGATLGPEQALGTVGGGLGCFINERIDLDDADKQLMFMSSMAGGIGSLFPSPMLTVMLFYELGKPPRDMVESMIIMGFSAMAAFIVGYPIIGATFLNYISQSSAMLSYDWKFELWHVLPAFVIGIISAFLSLSIMITVGVNKQIFARIRMRLARFPFLRQVIPPLIGGAVIGTINWALPMTFGNGNMLLHNVVKMTYHDELGWDILCCSAFARAFILGVSMNSGFIGGFIFPMMSIAIFLAMVCYKHNMYNLPIGLCISCFLAGVPGGVCPMPFTLSLLPILLFNFGAYQSACIFISALTSYSIVSGSGLILALQARAVQAEKIVKEKERASLEDQHGEHDSIDRGVSMPRVESEPSLNLSKYLDNQIGR